MMKRFPLVLFGIGSLTLAPLPGAQAQEPAATAPATKSSLQEVLERLEAINAESVKKVEAVQKVINEELVAKRITDSSAQSLRFGLRALSPTSGTEPLVSAWSAARLSTDNATLSTALKTLEGDLGAADAERFALIKKGCAEVRNSVTAAIRSAKTVPEIDTQLSLAERLQQTLPVRSSSTTNALGAQHLTSHISLLRNLRQVVSLQSANPVDSTALGSALMQLQNTVSSSQSVVDNSIIQQRIQDTIAPYHKAQDEAQEAVEAALKQSKPSKEIIAAIVKLEESIERFPSVSSSLKKRDLSSAVEVYRNLAAARASIEEGKYAQAKSQLSNLRSYSLKPLGAAKAPAFTQLVGDWTNSIDELAATAAAKRVDTLRARLAAVRSAADLEKLSLELAKVENENRDRELDFQRGLAGQLSALAAAWAVSSPNLLRANPYENTTVTGDVRLAKELAELRRRAERHILAETLRLPELLQPPLAEKSLDEAIEVIITQMAGKEEWRRMLQVVEARSGQNRNNYFPGGDVDLAGALRAYIAGQNMELADQWVEAMQSYKTVLRSTSERAPTKQAAERVKVLASEHADLFKPAPPATPPATGAPAPAPR
jgi:hypothetical protein